MTIKPGTPEMDAYFKKRTVEELMKDGIPRDKAEELSDYAAECGRKMRDGPDGGVS